MADTWHKVTFNTQNIERRDNKVVVTLPKSSKYKGRVIFHPASLVDINTRKWTAVVNFSNTWVFKLYRKGQTPVELTAKEFLAEFTNSTLDWIDEDDQRAYVTEDTPEALNPESVSVDPELAR